MQYSNISTAKDIMKESLIYGCELDGLYGFPILECNASFPVDTVDFRKSLKLNDVKKLNINFFQNDYDFNCVWNNPDKYMKHFRCFQSICGFDFSISVTSPLALQIYNKYRNHVLTWYFWNNGVKVIPKVDLLLGCSDWIYDGLPRNSMLCCSTNGRAYNREAKESFIKCFAEMESILCPHTMIIVGTKIDFSHKCDIIWLDTNIQKISKTLTKK